LTGALPAGCIERLGASSLVVRRPLVVPLDGSSKQLQILRAQFGNLAEQRLHFGYEFMTPVTDLVLVVVMRTTHDNYLTRRNPSSGIHAV
jgi:hypothetical protein